MAYAYECIKCHMNGKTCMKWANVLKIHDYEKKNEPRGFSAPAPGAIIMHIAIIFKDFL